jgi:zinc/manganese transport system substrate-binding protein
MKQKLVKSHPLKFFSGGVCLVVWFIFGCFIGLFADQKIRIVTVNDDFSSVATSIGQELVHVTSLVHGSKNMHDIQPKPSMVMALKHADMIIRLGMDQDSWLDGLLQVARNPKLFSNQMGYLDASKNIRKLEVPTHDIDGSHGDVHLEGNPHYSLNPMNGVIIADSIRHHLVAIDPKNRAAYDKNFNEFSTHISQKMVQWKQQMAAVQKNKFMSYHKVWAYFYDAFELDSMGTLELVPGVPPTIKHLKHLKETVKQKKWTVIVLTANYYPKKVGQGFAKDTHATSHHLYTNVGEDGIEAYTDLFDYLVTEISK